MCLSLCLRASMNETSKRSVFKRSEEGLFPLSNLRFQKPQRKASVGLGLQKVPGAAFITILGINEAS